MVNHQKVILKLIINIITQIIYDNLLLNVLVFKVKGLKEILFLQKYYL